MKTIARGLSVVDVHYLGRPGIVATAVLESASGVALIDPGPASGLESLRAGLAAQGRKINNLRAIFLTHIHLDHAGATGTLVRENPSIHVYVHERGTPHLIDPVKLLASARRLYGDEMDRMFGEFAATPAGNIRSLAGGERLTFGDHQFEVAYTPGHASHHVCYFEEASRIVFTGDVAGIRLERSRYVMPPTPPPDIDLDAWRTSVERIEAWHPSTLFLTHFGPSEGSPRAHLQAALEHLDELARIARRVVETEGTDETRERAFIDEAGAYLRRHLSASEVEDYEVAVPLRQCWLGLARYWKKRGETRVTGG